MVEAEIAALALQHGHRLPEGLIADLARWIEDGASPLGEPAAGRTHDFFGPARGGTGPAPAPAPAALAEDALDDLGAIGAGAMERCVACGIDG